MPAIYTDQQGTGYDLEQLRSAYASGAFAPGSRVPDILAQYPGSAAPPITMPGGTGSEGTPVSSITDPGRRKIQLDSGDVYRDQSTPVDPQTSAAPSSTPNMPAPGNNANAVYGYYSKYLGRNPENDQVVQSWLGGGLSLGQIENAIANSPEAMTYAKSNGFGNPPAAGPTTSTKTPYDTSSQSLLLNAVLQRLSQLQRPIQDPYGDLFAKMALDRVNQLGGAPFTDNQNAALLTQHMQPLTQARDTAKQQAAEEMSRRGIIPSSGVFQDRMKAIDTAYQRGVAGVTNTLNIQGIDQTTKNQQLQLQTLGTLVEMGRLSRQEADQRSQQIVQTAAMPFNTDLQTLTALTNAGGTDNASSLISSLMQLANVNLTGTQITTQQNGQDAQALGAAIGYALAHHAEFGF